MSSYDTPLITHSYEESTSTRMDLDHSGPSTGYVALPSSDNSANRGGSRRTLNSTYLSGRQSQQQNVQHLSLYSHDDNGDTAVEVLDIPSRTSTNDDETTGGIIEGRLTASFTDSTGGYDNLAGVGTFGWDEPSTTIALDLCKKYVLNPYHILLKLIGWRSFRSRFDPAPLYKRICNVVYPIFIFSMLIFACIAQITTCFSRSQSQAPVKKGNYSVLMCDDHIVTQDLISYLLILSSYIVGFVIFRFSETENLSSLSETVFLSYNYTSVNKSRKRPVFVLLGFLVSGVLWFFLSFGVSILRIFALKLDKSNTLIHWFTNSTYQLTIDQHVYDGLHYSLVSFAMLGFVFFDLLYIAVVINYASQCQMLSFYIDNIVDKVQNKHYKNLNTATKEVYHVYEFLKVLNGKLAFITTAVIFVFVVNVISSYKDLSGNDPHYATGIALGFLNVFQWILAVVFPVAMATLLTAKGRSIRTLGLQVACRPFVFSDTPDLELEMFLNYTNSTRYAAKIALVPMYPAFVIGGSFILFLLVTLGIFVPRVNSVSWF
ncbi:PREDICTED: uncharacterized protein LOC105313927 [Amphimedon queenslandica]|uniref:Uncharacterized protein n=1 Tax=Amphimedon queenslandica TaxID=400682 RepID=A0A1X7U4M9_AMPQE|nr:PREDICTED: uncharacterized protein LOC105313927 [Amphimedon queenslandica]|eukprot:XP_019856102.1 PREDICTED: uncharacterized protein LOC105313927 [Amphimedon queenslandica]